MAQPVTIDRVQALIDILQCLLRLTDEIPNYEGARGYFQGVAKQLQPLVDDPNNHHPGDMSLVALLPPLYETMHLFGQACWSAFVDHSPKTDPNYNLIADGAQKFWRQAADLFEDAMVAYVAYAQTA